MYSSPIPVPKTSYASDQFLEAKPSNSILVPPLSGVRIFSLNIYTQFYFHIKTLGDTNFPVVIRGKIYSSIVLLDFVE